MPEYTIYLGADHRGFEKKNELAKLLENCHPGMVKVRDLGAFEYVADDDFNDPAKAVARAIREDEHSFGVLVCASAHGVTMQANRFKGVRAINAQDTNSATLGRLDDYANVVCLSADRLNPDEMEKIVKIFCHTQPKTEEKYRRRMQKLDQLEES